MVFSRWNLSKTQEKIKYLVKNGQVRISVHGYDELSEDNIFARDIIDGVEKSVLVEDYPDYHKGPCILVKQLDHKEDPLHVVWGIPKGKDHPAVVVTAYRPDSNLWSDDYTRRKR